MIWVHLVALLAVGQYLLFGILVAQARGRYGVQAPAVTGHEGFERVYRVQMNTLELLVALLPSLWLAAQYWSPPLMAGIGLVYLGGRMLYWQAYVRNPAGRALGYTLSFLPVAVLLFAALAGVARTLAG